MATNTFSAIFNPVFQFEAKFQFMKAHPVLSFLFDGSEKI
jgi:hypothetical protein